MKHLLIILSAITFTVLYSCATSEPVTDSNVSGDEDESETILNLPEGSYEEFVDIKELNEVEKILYENRSRMSDLFASRSHDMPEHFLREVEEEEESDIYAGFRIQVLSTRDMELADTTQTAFNAWADTTFQGYIPRAYVFFRQPFYRVRVGDFNDRERAIEFSRKIKSRYPDAWVVHDRINPFRSPPDSVQSGNIN
ncbi:MAG: SPOR domain-containing protein [Balneolaceae bacterium]